MPLIHKPQIAGIANPALPDSQIPRYLNHKPQVTGFPNLTLAEPQTPRYRYHEPHVNLPPPRLIIIRALDFCWTGFGASWEPGAKDAR